MIDRPFRLYAMSLVERLGFKTLKQMYEQVSSFEIMEWMAYDLLKNPETHAELKRASEVEAQRNNTLEQEADLMRNLFMNLGK